MILAIIGPTGVGKTTASISLAKYLDAIIINCDSKAIYKELNIGTAKVTESEMKGVKHYLIGNISINENYSVYNYQKQARAILDKALLQKKNVIIVGGTGLYLKALLYDYKFDKEIKYDFSNITLEDLLVETKHYDDFNIDPNNRQRIERFLIKKRNNSSSYNNSKKLYHFKIIGLTTNRDNLYKIINDRVDLMFEKGLLKEAHDLYIKDKNNKVLSSTIGYQELLKYFNNEKSLDKAKELIKKNSRHYAKRQYTFFNNQFNNITWYETNYKNFDNTINNIKEGLEKFREQ